MAHYGIYKNLDIEIGGVGHQPMPRLYTTRGLYLTFRGPLIFWTALERVWALGIKKIRVSGIMRIVISALRRQFPKFKKCLFLVFVLTIAPFLGLPRILILCLKGLVVNITRGSCLAFGGPLDLWKALEGAKMW